MSRIGIRRDRRWWIAVAWVAVAYGGAFLAAAAALRLLPSQGPWWDAVAADLIATCAVFAFSVAFRNSSFYDPYWSVAPPVIAAWWVLHPLLADGNRVRATLALTVVTLWGVRLTVNWLRGWGGLDHEDWRYVELRRRSGRAWWLVSLCGVHLYPTVQVLLGCLGLYHAIASTRAVGPLDGVAFAVALVATVVEGTADAQLRAWRAANDDPGACVDRGLWRWSRHPNYLGEVLFWFGIWGLGAAGGAPGWTVLGPLSMLALFVFISVPMMERRLVARRPRYADQQRRVSMLLPLPIRRRPSRDEQISSP